jgi:hypothetical protein
VTVPARSHSKRGKIIPMAAPIPSHALNTLALDWERGEVSDETVLERLMEIGRRGTPPLSNALLDELRKLRNSIGSGVEQQLLVLQLKQIAFAALSDADAKRPAASVGLVDLDSEDPAHPTVPTDPAAAAIHRFNARHALVNLSGSVVVLREREGAGGQQLFDFMRKEAFRDWTRPETVLIRGRETPIADIWLASKDRRQYDGVTFAPGAEIPGLYNLWNGWPYEPDAGAGSCERFLDHIGENVCSGNTQHYEYFMGFFAALFQHPRTKLGTALAIRGAPGTGKTIAFKTVGRLVGRYHALVASPRYLTGRFNGHLIDKILLQLDEAFFSGDHATDGQLKDLITNDMQFVELKGREAIAVPNLVRVVATSNENWVVPAQLAERRWFVLDIGEKRIRDHAFFAAMQEEMDAGGYSALLHHLMSLDIADVNLHDIPHTQALAEQKMLSMTPELSWWLTVLIEGTLPGDRDGDGASPTEVVYEDYLESAQRRGIQRRASNTAFGMFLMKHAPGTCKSRRARGNSPRCWYYQLPPLRVCRRLLSTGLQYTPEWADPEDEWSPDPAEPR